MVICAQCGEHNAEDARFCASCNAFLEWAGSAEGQPVAAVAAEPAVASVAQPSEQVRQQPRPAATVTEPPRRRPPAPGDLVCGRCGEGNQPTRQFCRRCGTSLADSVPVRLPWWRRLLRWLRPRRDRIHVASRLGHDERRGRHNRVGRTVRRVLRWARNIIAIVVALGAVAYGVFPSFRHTVNADVLGIEGKAIGGLVTKYTPVHADKVAATVALPGHSADLVNDNTIGTYWAAPTNGVEPALVLTLDHRANLARAIIRSGIGNDFQSADRPKTLHLVYSTGRTYDVNLADTPDAQQVSLGNGAGATSVEVHVTAVYHALHGGIVAIDEIELFEQN